MNIGNCQLGGGNVGGHYGLFTLSDTENENEVYTDADNMRNTSHCSDSDSDTDCDKMQNSLLTCPK